MLLPNLADTAFSAKELRSTLGSSPMTHRSSFRLSVKLLNLVFFWWVNLEMNIGLSL